MSYSIKDIKELEKLNELVSLQNRVQEIRLQYKLGKQNIHEDMKKVFEPVSKSLENTSQDLTKTMTENSIKNNKALDNLKNKLVKIMNDTGKIADYLMSPSPSNRVNDLLTLLNNSIPITLHDNLLTFLDTN